MSDRLYARRRQSPKERILAQWKGTDPRHHEVVHAPTTKTSSHLIQGVVKKVRLEKRQSDNEILKAWNDLLDPNIVAHAQPDSINNGTLFVNVDHSIWLDEIVRYRRSEILTRLQHCFGSQRIKKISFRLG